MTHLSEEQLIAFVLGDATDDARTVVETHAATCERCRSEIGTLRATLEACPRSRASLEDFSLTDARGSPRLPS